MARKFYKEDNQQLPAIEFVETQPVGFTEITNADEIKRLYILQYSERKADGQQFVVDFTADLYIDVLGGTYTEAEVFALEEHIGSIYADLNNGWWLTAQNANQNLSLAGIYTQVMKDDIQDTIDDYVTNNY
jgi:hypothetical protein